MGLRRPDCSEHDLTLERPRELCTAMSKMGKSLAVSPHEEKKSSGSFAFKIQRQIRGNVQAMKRIINTGSDGRQNPTSNLLAG